MAELTPEQQRALATAAARLRLEGSRSGSPAQAEYEVALENVRAKYFSDMSPESWREYSRHSFGPYSVGELNQHGTLFGTSDEIASAISSLRGLPGTLGGGGPNMAEAWGDFQRLNETRLALGREQAGALGIAAEVAGAIPTAGASLPALAGRTIGQRALIGAGGAAVEGGVYGFADTPGGIQERATGGAVTGLVSAPIGAAAPYVGRLAGDYLRRGSQRSVVQALERDGIPLADVDRRLQELGPDAVLADLGPNLQWRSAALATMPGRAQSEIVDRLSMRRAGANDRIAADVDAALGPSPIPSVIDSEIQESMAQFQPVYNELFRNARRVDTTPIAETLDAKIVNLRGPEQRAAEQVRAMLDVYGEPGNLDPNPYTLFQVRQAIDGMLDGEVNTKVIRLLTETRQQVDATLANAVPGIKSVDAQFAELARQREGLTEGQALLRSGVTQPRPEELGPRMSAVPPTPSALQVAIMGPSGVPMRIRQGVRSEIDRIIGQNANDRAAMNRILRGGDGRWNREHLVTVFGEEKADKVLAILEREARFQEHEAIAISGARTQGLRAAQEELSPSQRNAGPVRNTLNLRIGDAAANVLDFLTGGATAAVREGRNYEIARLLMAGPGSSEINTLAAGRTVFPARPTMPTTIERAVRGSALPSTLTLGDARYRMLSGQ